MRMTARRMTASLVLAMLIAAAAWAARPAPEPRTNLRIVAMRYLSFAPIFIALDEGFFEQEGLDVEFYAVSRSDAAIPPLIQGDVDVVPAAIMPSYFNVIQRGATMKVVAGKGHHAPNACPYSGIMVSRKLLESGTFSSVADARGLVVSIDRSSPSYFRLDRFLEMGGLTLDDMRIIDIPGPTRLDAFDNGALHITTVSEPWISLFRRAGHAELWMESRKLMPGFQFGHLLFGKSLLEERPEDGEKFMRAYLRAVRQLNRDGSSPRNIEILAKYTRLDEALLAEACWPTIRNDGRVQTEDLLAFQHWALEEGLISQIMPSEQVYDPRFVESANRTLDATKSQQP
jgi:NitT/TauT family transport system substrate-binding protein